VIFLQVKREKFQEAPVDFLQDTHEMAAKAAACAGSWPEMMGVLDFFCFAKEFAAACQRTPSA